MSRLRDLDIAREFGSNPGYAKIWDQEATKGSVHNKQQKWRVEKEKDKSNDETHVVRY